MPRVLCTLPNAGSVINGVSFSKGEGGRVSEEISQPQADRFAAIPGYEIVAGAAKPEPDKAPEQPKSANKPNARA